VTEILGSRSHNLNTKKGRKLPQRKLIFKGDIQFSTSIGRKSFCSFIPRYIIPEILSQKSHPIFFVTWGEIRSPKHISNGIICSQVSRGNTANAAGAILRWHGTGSKFIHHEEVIDFPRNGLSLGSQEFPYQQGDVACGNHDFMELGKICTKKTVGDVVEKAICKKEKAAAAITTTLFVG